MGMIIDIERRVIELDNGAKLRFQDEDRFFYLRVIALVAQAMKDKSEQGEESPFVFIGEIEDQAWTFSRHKPRPFKDRKSMKTLIYQTWKQKITDPNGGLYDVIWPESTKPKPDLCGLFEIKVGLGPQRAAYKIAEKPENLDIVKQPSPRESCSVSDYAAFDVGGLDEDQKVQAFLQFLREFMTPATYQNAISKGCQASQAFFRSEEFSTTSDNGSLPYSIGHYAERFVQYLGMQNVPGDSLLWLWMDELARDPRWDQLVTIIAESPPSCDELSGPRILAKRFAKEGDLPSLVWLFHMAYVSSAFGVKCKRFFSLLDKEATSVRLRVYEDIAVQIAGNKAGAADVLEDRDKALRVLYHKVELKLR